MQQPDYKFIEVPQGKIVGDFFHEDPSKPPRIIMAKFSHVSDGRQFYTTKDWTDSWLKEARKRTTLRDPSFSEMRGTEEYLIKAVWRGEIKSYRTHEEAAVAVHHFGNTSRLGNPVRRGVPPTAGSVRAYEREGGGVLADLGRASTSARNLSERAQTPAAHQNAKAAHLHAAELADRAGDIDASAMHRNAARQHHLKMRRLGNPASYDQNPSEQEMYYQSFNRADWAHPSARKCACRGSGYALSELDTIHACPFHHVAGQHHPEETCPCEQTPCVYYGRQKLAQRLRARKHAQLKAPNYTPSHPREDDDGIPF